jgi:hypothetical protein
MFERLRQSLNDLRAAGGARPEERRRVASQMKESLVLARVALDDLRKGADQTRARLAKERGELETVLRRKTLAVGINDAQTVQVAERFERQHAERVEVLERKLAAQESELALAEREVQEMTAELRAAISGAPMPGGSVGTGAAAGATVDDDPLADIAPDADARDPLREEISSLDRQQRRAANDARADALLAELKRRMGK